MQEFKHGRPCNAGDLAGLIDEWISGLGRAGLIRVAGDRGPELAYELHSLLRPKFAVTLLWVDPRTYFDHEVRLGEDLPPDGSNAFALLVSVKA